MATVDKTKGAASVPMLQAGAHRFVLYNLVTLSTGDVVDGNVIQVLKVCKGMRVHGVQIEMVTAGSATTITANVGDGDDADGYDASVNLKSAAGTVTMTAIGTDAYGASGKLYTTDDTIDLTLSVSGTVTAAPAFKVWADCAWYKDL